MTKKDHKCDNDCKSKNKIYCKICREYYIDCCFMHYAIKDSWQ